MSVYLTMPEAAAMLGITRQRLHQLIAKRRDIAVEDTVTKANANGQRKAIALATVLRWRSERAAAGQSVGPIPDRLLAPPKPPDDPPAPIGLNIFRPFG